MATTSRAVQPHDMTTLEPSLTLARRELVRLLIGEALLPGPHGLCSHIGRVLDIQPHDHVLLVSSNPAASAASLAEEFGCSVVAVTTKADQLERSRRRAERTRRVEVRAGSIERLPFRTQRFSVAISEGAFAASSDKAAAATQLHTVLSPKGRVALAEPTLYREMISEELVPLFTWLTPFAGARPAGVYRSILAERGFTDFITEDRRGDVLRAAEIARQKLMLVGLTSTPEDLGTQGEDVEASVRLAQSVLDLISKGVASFTLVTAERP